MSRVFLISDTHWGHTNTVTKFKRKDGSPLRDFIDVDDMDQRMIANWNAVVGDYDIVWHLGDVVVNKKHLYKQGLCKGRKFLIRGNHDYVAPTEEYYKVFEKIYSMKELDGYLLTHIPVHPNSVGRWKGNIHGHMHSYSLKDARYCCVSVERIDYTPILFEKAKEMFGNDVN